MVTDMLINCANRCCCFPKIVMMFVLYSITGMLLFPQDFYNVCVI